MPNLGRMLETGLDAQVPHVSSAARRVAFGLAGGLGLANVAIPALSGATLGPQAGLSGGGTNITHNHNESFPITVEVSADEFDGDPRQAGENLGNALGPSLSQAWTHALAQRGYNN